MNKRIIAIIIFIVIVAVSSGIFYWQKNSKKVEQKEEIKKTVDNEIIVEEKKVTLKTYQNKLWGIEFQYPGDREVFIRDLGGQLNISVYTKKELNYKNELYFNPIALKFEEVVDFDSLKNYLDNNVKSDKITVIKNSNGVNFYKLEIKNAFTNYYVFYKGKKPFNAIKFRHRNDNLKLENKELFESIIDSFKYIDIDDKLAETFFKERKINPECAGWYASDGYRGKSTLKNLSEIQNTEREKEYSLFNDGKISFYFPEDWKAEKVEYIKDRDEYRIFYLENVSLKLSINNIEDFKNIYNKCLNKCFDDTDPSALFSWDATKCSNDFSENNLEKFLSENYVDNFSTGSLPPGGAGNFIFRKVYNDVIVSAFYSSEDFQFYPKANKAIDGKHWDDLAEDEKQIIFDEQNYYDEEFYKIIKSAKVLSLNKE